MSGSKLVENLAESLVNELSESKTLDLMNDAKFSEFTDVLWEILDKVDKAEDRAKEKESSDKNEELKNKIDNLDKSTEKIKEISKDTRKSVINTKNSIINYLMQAKENVDSENNSEENGNGNDGEKKKLKLGLKKKNHEDINKKITLERKEEERTELNKQTVQMLVKLTKNFEESEKKRKKENSLIRRGLKSVNRKLGSMLWKVFNKFKSWLVVGLLIIFAKPIWNALKGVLEPIWEDHIKPKFKEWFDKLGAELGKGFEAAKKWFKDTFPNLNEWIKNDWPKVKDWFKNNWNKVKTWFKETFPIIPQIINKFLELPVIRGWVRDYRLNKNEERQAEIKSALTTEYDPAKRAALQMEYNKLFNEHLALDSEKWYKRDDLGSWDNFNTVNSIRNIEFPVDYENGQWKYEKLDLPVYDYKQGTEGLEEYNKAIENAYKKLEPRIIAAREKFRQAANSFNADSYADTINATMESSAPATIPSFSPNSTMFENMTATQDATNGLGGNNLIDIKNTSYVNIFTRQVIDVPDPSF